MYTDVYKLYTCVDGEPVLKFNYDVFSSFSVILRQINLANEEPSMRYYNVDNCGYYIRRRRGAHRVA